MDGAGAEPARAQADAVLLPLITQAHRESRRTYGRPHIAHWLQTHGKRCGHMRVARLMRPFHPQSLTDSNHDLPVAPNLLRRREPTVQPDAVWVADITHVPTDEGWLHVAGVLDLCTCRCVGWALDDTLATSLPLAALNMALYQRCPPTGLGASLQIAECNTPVRRIVSRWRRPAAFPA